MLLDAIADGKYRNHSALKDVIISEPTFGLVSSESHPVTLF
jgi:hypothetical protein